MKFDLGIRLLAIAYRLLVDVDPCYLTPAVSAKPIRGAAATTSDIQKSTDVMPREKIDDAFYRLFLAGMRIVPASDQREYRFALRRVHSEGHELTPRGYRLA
jgi:hypothetical protein